MPSAHRTALPSHGFVPALVCAALLGCGGEATVGTSGGSDSTSTGAGAGGEGTTTTTSTSSGSGGGTSTTTTTTSTSSNACEGQPCGTFCQACEPECVSGHCDGVGHCVPWDWDGSDQCPPSDQVSSGVSCATEALMCASDASCSGYLLCVCGEWTLINPC